MATFTNLVIVALWIYYSSIVFILGGELGRIAQVHRGKGHRPGWGLRGPVPEVARSVRSDTVSAWARRRSALSSSIATVAT